MNLFRLVFILYLFLFINISHADEYKGTVLKVIDGDTILVLTSTNKRNKVRLSYIDAPEMNQQYGKSSKIFLEKIILNQNIIINTEENDRYGRQLGEVYLYTHDKRVFINAKMIKSGNAWVYKIFRSNIYLLNLEEHARINKLGLWAHPPIIEPWTFRKK
tara:strand:+ start:84 stop:563 length:480 start_codon:yes stop_codon:yes gene_type:complete